MKKYIYATIATVLLSTQFSFAASIPDGGDKRAARDAASMGTPVNLGEPQAAAFTEQEMQEMSVPASTETTAEIATSSTTKTIGHETTAPEVKLTNAPHAKKRAFAPNRIAAQKHEGGRGIGTAALVFGILGFLLGWVLWPIGLLFGLLAIILGIIGIVGNRGIGMSIAGVILGFLTLLLPVLIVAIIIAAVL